MEAQEEGGNILDWLSRNKRDIAISTFILLISVIGLVQYTKSTLPKPKRV